VVIDVTRLSRMFPGQPDSIWVARSFAWVFAVAHVPHDVADTIELVVSELSTNAVEHTASGLPGGHFVLELEARGGFFRVAVVDMGSSTAPTQGEGGDDSYAVSGRGLFVVDAVAKQWASEPVRVGRRVWADLAVEE
jgi:anti-sigma regulatory factor (Ser/Thr protein kinase)